MLPTASRGKILKNAPVDMARVWGGSFARTKHSKSNPTRTSCVFLASTAKRTSCDIKRPLIQLAKETCSTKQESFCCVANHVVKVLPSRKDNWTSWFPHGFPLFFLYHFAMFCQAQPGFHVTMTSTEVSRKVLRDSICGKSMYINQSPAITTIKQMLWKNNHFLPSSNPLGSRD